MKQDSSSRNMWSFSYQTNIFFCLFISIQWWWRRRIIWGILSENLTRFNKQFFFKRKIKAKKAKFWILNFTQKYPQDTKVDQVNNHSTSVSTRSSSINFWRINKQKHTHKRRLQFPFLSYNSCFFFLYKLPNTITAAVSRDEKSRARKKVTKRTRVTKE